MGQPAERLTREAILVMPAGPEIDRLVAERVMGWTEGREDDGTLYWATGDNAMPGTWSPSSDINAALDVMDRLKRRYVREVEVRGESLPLAISRFALIATL